MPEFSTYPVLLFIHVLNTLLVSAVLMRQRAAPPRAAKERTPVVST
jgi:hypothetical protein